MAGGQHRRSRELQANALGRADAVVMAVAGAAPAYTISASTATLIAAVGLASPAALLWCGLPMLGVAWAYRQLSSKEVNAGAAYSWVGRALHPTLGYLSGWALVVSTTLFMVAGSLPAGALTVGLFSERLTDQTLLVTVVGGCWFAVMVGVVLFGVRITSRAQWLMTGVEVGILIVFAALALIRAPGIAARSFSWSWLGFEHFSGFRGFVGGALIAAFFYWGWDVSANLSEETRHARRTPGLAGLAGVVIIFGLYESFTIIANMLLRPDQLAKSSGNLVGVLGQAIWPGVGGTVMSLAVMLSTVATLETTLVQVTRTLFAMGRDLALPPRFAETHPRWKTPWFATIVVAAVALALLVASTALGSVGAILEDAISAIGLQIAVYYGLAGLAVVVAHRRRIVASVADFLLMGLWPLAGAGFMFWIFVESVPSLGHTVVAIGVGSLAAGLVPMAYYWAKGSPYFRLRAGRHAQRRVVWAEPPP